MLGDAITVVKKKRWAVMVVQYGYAMVEALWARRKPSYAAAGAGDVFSLFHLQPGYVIHVTTGGGTHTSMCLSEWDFVKYCLIMCIAFKRECVWRLIPLM